MKTMNLFGMLFLFFCILFFMNCSHEDDGNRGFVQEATIIGDSIHGYHCYFDGGGLAISSDRRLEGIERGYFAFHYKEEDWIVSDNHEWYIQHAYVFPYSIYRVLHPISIAEAEAQHITDKDSCQIPPLFSLEYGYRGYFDFSTGLAVVNPVNVEKVPVQINMVYDPDQLTPDTLFLQLCYHPRIPDGWQNTGFDYGKLSCDISSLATLKPWRDSITIVVETGDQKRHLTKIGKNDFLKPTLLYTHSPMY